MVHLILKGSQGKQNVMSSIKLPFWGKLLTLEGMHLCTQEILGDSIQIHKVNQQRISNVTDKLQQ